MDSLRFKGFSFRYSSEDEPVKGNFNRHCHNMYEIIYIERGTGTFFVESTSYEVVPGSILIFRPREFHFFSVNEGATYARYVINFDEKNVMDASPMLLDIFNNRSLGSNNMFTDVDKSITDIFNGFLIEDKYNETEAAILAKCNLNKFLCVFHNTYLDKNKGDTNGNLINRIISYVNENISSTIRLEELAERFFISKYYLGHLFKKYTGLPAMEYIIRKRTVMAQQLISEGYQASRAAAMSGFNDYSSFYRAYTKYIGKRPSAENKSDNDV